MLFLLFTCTVAFWDAKGASIQEIQEVRLSKAELAMIDGKEKLALRILAQNLNSKYFHFETYVYLAEYHLSKGSFSKGFRVYYYILKKIHTSTLTRAKFDENFIYKLYNSPAPTRQALEIYYKIAQTYYNIYEEGVFNVDFNKSLLLLSKKYFSIISYYRHELASTKLYLGLIASAQKKHSQAIEIFIEAKELFTNNKSTVTEINIMLGEEFIKNGFTDVASIFFKNVYLAKDTNASLREYSNSYLEALSSTYLSISASLNTKYSSNLHNLTEKEIGDFANSSNSEIYNKVSGITNSKEANLFYNRKLFKYWSSLFFFYFVDESASSADLKTKNYRSYTSGVTLKYDNLIKSTARIKYSYNTLYLTPSNNGDLTKYSKTHSITPQYTHTLKKGIITYSLPYNVSIINNTTETDLGISVSYSPYWRSKYIFPTYSIQYDSIDEGEDDPRSQKLTFSIGNQATISSNFSLYFNTALYLTNNTSPALKSRELYFFLSLSYLFEAIKNLSANASIGQTTESYASNDKINTLTTSLGLSYTF